MTERKCKFVKAWIGDCGENADESGYCPNHEAMKCCSCKSQATHECDMTGTQFVCGSPLCDDCEHGAPDPKNPGWFNLGGGHHPKPESAAAAVRAAREGR